MVQSQLWPLCYCLCIDRSCGCLQIELTTAFDTVYMTDGFATLTSKKIFIRLEFNPPF